MIKVLILKLAFQIWVTSVHFVWKILNMKGHSSSSISRVSMKKPLFNIFSTYLPIAFWGEMNDDDNDNSAAQRERERERENGNTFLMNERLDKFCALSPLLFRIGKWNERQNFIIFWWIQRMDAARLLWKVLKARLSVNDIYSDEVYFNTDKYIFTQVDKLDHLLNWSSKIGSFAQSGWA